MSPLANHLPINTKHRDGRPVSFLELWPACFCQCSMASLSWVT